ncbi:MAG: 50S ribosomal protein L22 [Acidobacteria bacterium]|nr:50S ribosomal protein L22 [Acidobacteriota bacterium]
MAKTAEKKTGREFVSQARFQRVSPQKAKLVLDMIKGQPVEKALTIVAFSKKRIAPVVEKALRSAVQNANYLSQEKGFDLDLDRLIVKSAVANEGPRLKRLRPAPMGRAFRYQRRLSNIVLTVAEKTSRQDASANESGAAEAVAPAKKSAAKKAPAKKAAAKKAPAKKTTAKKAE